MGTLHLVVDNLREVVMDPKNFARIEPEIQKVREAIFTSYTTASWRQLLSITESLETLFSEYCDEDIRYVNPQTRFENNLYVLGVLDTLLGFSQLMLGNLLVSTVNNDELKGFIRFVTRRLQLGPEDGFVLEDAMGWVGLAPMSVFNKMADMHLVTLTTGEPVPRIMQGPQFELYIDVSTKVR